MNTEGVAIFQLNWSKPTAQMIMTVHGTTFGVTIHFWH